MTTHPVNLMLTECFVESWRRRFDANGKEFISYKIIIKDSSEGSERFIERRYSEFYKLHQEVIKWFTDGNLSSLLTESFPSKQFLTIQTDAFAEKRARALDAYLQILTHCLRERRLLGHELIKDFFGIVHESEMVNSNNSNNPINTGSNRTAGVPVIKTPNTLNNEIEHLRSVLHTTKDLKILKQEFDLLQETILGHNHQTQEDLKLMEKFYEVKREWEVMKIKRGEQYDGFDMKIVKVTSASNRIDANCRQISKTTVTTNEATLDSNTVSANTLNTNNTLAKHHLREQEAILSDLADTLRQQKQVSLEICEEIIEQNRVIGEFGRSQEGTIEGFMKSSDRARKLQ